MTDISLLPEGMRRKEEELKKAAPKPTPSPVSELRFSAPTEEGDDVEVIEIDEGDVEQVLASEPFFTRLYYKTATLIEGVAHKLFQPHEPEPPPKLPPQFFVPPPPKPKPAPVAPATPVSPAAVPSAAALVVPPAPLQAKPKIMARVVPSEKTPRRVRVIKRVRKPVRVSFVSDEELRLLHIDVSKRRFTLITLLVLFGVLLGGGTYALSQLQSAADRERTAADQQLSDIRQQIGDVQRTWSSFQNLEPRLRALSGLLDAHVSPTFVLERIERTTLPSVSYQSFSLSSDRKVVLGVITDSYESAARQVAAFQSSGFVVKTDASNYAAQYDASGSLLPISVSFQMMLQLTDAALNTRPSAVATP